MGVTEPDDDLTELSSRKKGADDATRLSARAVTPPDDDDDTRLSTRGRAAPVVDDDGTRLSPRLAVPAAPPADETRVSSRPSTTSGATRSGGKAALSPLPPGVLGGAAAELGTFGQPPAEYEARELPLTAPERPAPTAVPMPAATAPDAERVRSRREAARHRKLITSVIVVAVTAALMTAAVIAIVALIRRGA